METVRPGPHLAGVLCNSLEVSSFARPGARDPRSGARSARRGEAGAPPRLGPTPSAAYTPPTAAAAPALRGPPVPGTVRGGRHAVRTLT